MRIVNPTFVIPPEEKNDKSSGKAAVDWLSDPIIFFGNSKPNSKEVMHALREKLADIRNVENIHYMSKPQAGVAATAAMIDQAAKNYKIAILGSAD